MRWLLMAVWALHFAQCVFPTYRVMALGDSITLGSPSYVPSESYRVKTLEGVESEGFGIEWVGPEKHVSQTHFHNGVSGRFIYQIRANFTASAATYDPEIVVVNGGTNDLFFPGNTAEKNETAMRLLIDDVIAHESVERVILTDLPTQPDKPVESADTSARYAAIADDYEQVLFAPAFADVQMTDTAQAIEHPTNAGYQEMGRQLTPYMLRAMRSMQ